MKVTTNSSIFKMKHTATEMPEFDLEDANIFSKVSTPNNGNVKKNEQGGVLVRYKNPL